MITRLQHELLELMSNYHSEAVPMTYLSKHVTQTRHPSRVRLALEDLERRGMVLVSDDYRWHVLVSGRRITERAAA